MASATRPGAKFSTGTEKHALTLRSSGKALKHVFKPKETNERLKLPHPPETMASIKKLR